MIFSAKNSDVAAILATGLKFVEKSKTVGVTVDKKNGATLRLMGDDGSYFHSMFPAKVTKGGHFSIGLDIFQALTKSKSLEIEYSVVDHKLHVKSLNTKLSGKDVPLLTDEVNLAEKSTSNVSFGKYQTKALLMMSECALPSFFQKILPQYIVASKGVLTVACADIMFSAIATFPTDKLTLAETCIPAQYARLMRDVVGDDCSITLKKDKIVVDTDILHIELPMIQMDTIATIDKILGLDASKPIASFSVETQVLKSELDNILVVYEDKSPISLKLKNNLILNYRTNRGTFNSTVKIENLKNAAEVHLDVEMFRTILGRCGGKIDVEVKKSVMCLTTTPIKGMSIKYIIALVNPGEG